MNVVTLHDLLVALDGDPRDALERFVARALHEGGVWQSPRASDGVASYRVIEQTLLRARVCGQIWNVDQTLHPFWLDFECGDVATWALYFDVDSAALSPRRARNALDSIDDPGDVSWAYTLRGDDPT